MATINTPLLAVPTTQEQIIQLLKSQDRKAMAMLYDKYGEALYGVVIRIVSSRELAQQVMQDTFLKVWRNGVTYDEKKGRLFTWMLNIARNTAIDATRTAHYRKSLITDKIENAYHLIDEESFNPDTVGLKEAVQKLDVKYKDLINLIYFSGYTQKDVAEQTNLPIGTVKTRIRSAILALRKNFD